LAGARRWPSGTAAQRPSGMSHAGIRTIKRPKQTRQGGPISPTMCLAWRRRPFATQQVGMLQFLIKLLLIKFRSNSFLQLLNTTLSLVVLVFSFWQGCVCLFLPSFIYSFISDWLCRKPLIFPLTRSELQTITSKLGPDHFCVTRM
jgi:hypothetical protein